MRSPTIVLFVVSCLLPAGVCRAQYYPDQFYTLEKDSLYGSLIEVDGVTYGEDGLSLVLQADRTTGYAMIKPQQSAMPFDQGLPSWNGSGPDDGSSFKIQVRFPYQSGWSPWLTVGFWKANVWASYGSTSYAGGFVDVDYVKLNSYVSAWQFRVTMTRTSAALPSPTLRRLSFFVSDSRATSVIDYVKILSDRPAAILIPTDFIYQYDVDPEIGGSICSPTSVSMILRSYSIPVDPLAFARDTYDPYYGIFGDWPRVVQNASEYGVDGAVTRYRTWSEAREVLAEGGRIAMSVGPPLYSGHLMMLAGFNVNGDPIVHDPARTNGYSYLYSKSDLSHSWFDKGGIAYTFYPAGTTPVSVERSLDVRVTAEGFRLEQNYPNPFNPSTTVTYHLPSASAVRLAVYDILGRQVAVLVNEPRPAGSYLARFDAAGLAAGVYFCRLSAGTQVESRKMILSR